MKTRLEWIDLAKCLAIILVALGHATGDSIVGKYIYVLKLSLSALSTGTIAQIYAILMEFGIF